MAFLENFSMMSESVFLYSKWLGNEQQSLLFISKPFTLINQIENYDAGYNKKGALRP